MRLKPKPHLRFLLGVWWCEGDDTTVCAQSMDDAWAIWLEGRQ